MKLNTAPENAVTMGPGVSDQGEYRINSSPKAFAILSSGLYANKIRAIIRELSCNALDSHCAAGKSSTPFDLHLPTQLEPWFAIRDYGTGLSDSQVVNIYTTYFESTKTDSNDFIGALGLGSKSPFGYTDNFTVTAVQDGHMGIYTAYINPRGVPAIAQMASQPTDQPSGVEVKFAVNDPRDFAKFKHEAMSVFTYFDVKPQVNIKDMLFSQPLYSQRDIIPGVHQYQGINRSCAIMGNISYPIDVPNSAQSLGDLHDLLNCGLELNFEIGQLDFQPSREGLSYIPMTIDAIRSRLEDLDRSLYPILAQQADAIENQWQRAMFLDKQSDNRLWRSSIRKYVTQTQFSLFTPDYSGWSRLASFDFKVDDLAARFNIAISGFTKNHGDLSAKMLKPGSRSFYQGNTRVIQQEWSFSVSDRAYFACNDTNTGSIERGKYHWNVNRDKIETANSTVYIANPVDKLKPMKFDEFMAALQNPHRQCKVSSWAKKPRVSKTKITGEAVKVLILVDKTSPRYRYTPSDNKIWREAGLASQLPSTNTYYYLPLSGYTLVSDYGYYDSKELASTILQLGLPTGVTDIYGVRKSDLDWVKTQKNWINVEDHIVEFFKNTPQSCISRIAAKMYQKNQRCLISKEILNHVTNPNSAYASAAQTLANVDPLNYSERSINTLVNRYSASGATSPFDTARVTAAKVKKELANYPLLELIESYSTRQVKLIADYINLVDQTLSNSLDNTQG